MTVRLRSKTRAASLLAAVALTIAALAAATAPPARSASPEVLWSPPPERLAALLSDYNAAISDAAVKKPGFRKKLRTIDPGATRIALATLLWTGGSDPVGNDGRLTKPLWAAHPDELQAACKGAADPVLALQQALGQPPRTGSYVLLRFKVRPGQVFRPCASGPEIGTPACEFVLPGDATVEARAKADADFAATQKFVYQQMWSSYVLKMNSFGYPFTAMGWTYDWNPKAKNIYGASEYIVRQNAPVYAVERVSPTAFCR